MQDSSVLIRALPSTISQHPPRQTLTQLAQPVHLSVSTLMNSPVPSIHSTPGNRSTVLGILILSGRILWFDMIRLKQSRIGANRKRNQAIGQPIFAVALVAGYMLAAKSQPFYQRPGNPQQPVQSTDDPLENQFTEFRPFGRVYSPGLPPLVVVNIVMPVLIIPEVHFDPAGNQTRVPPDIAKNHAKQRRQRMRKLPQAPGPVHVFPQQAYIFTFLGIAQIITVLSGYGPLDNGMGPDPFVVLAQK